ncbi:MAG TPA: hypothetical protein VFV34_29580, partial [Blastocatellia bacterium]|nr:hypothetical protein [Blastocatellia bacterium]
MSITFVDVSTYLVFAYGGPDGNAGVDSSISLGIPNGFVFLHFYPDGATVPPNKKEIHAPTGNPIFYVNYRYAQFANVIDLLRNEKPIRFLFNDVNLGAYIT